MEQIEKLGTRYFLLTNRVKTDVANLFTYELRIKIPYYCNRLQIGLGSPLILGYASTVSKELIEKHRFVAYFC
jgi:hypothetical protein